MHQNEQKRSPIGKRIEMLILVENLHRAAALAKKLGFAPSGLSAILTGKTKQPGDKFWRAIREHYPAWEQYLRGEASGPPKTIYEQSDPKPLAQPDSDRGSYGIPDLSRHEVQSVAGPEIEWYIDAVRKILLGGDLVLKATIQIVIRESYSSLKHEKILRERINLLEEELNGIKKSLASPVDPPEAKEA